MTATMTRRLAVKGLAAGLVAALARRIGGEAPSAFARDEDPPVEQQPLPDDVSKNLDCEADPPGSNTYICTDRTNGDRYECTYYPSSGAWFCNEASRSGSRLGSGLRRGSGSDSGSGSGSGSGDGSLRDLRRRKRTRRSRSRR